jgi:hypothetical protein
MFLGGFKKMITKANLIIEVQGSYKASLNDRFFHKCKTMLGFSLLLLICFLFIPMHATGETIFESGFERGVTMSDFIPSGKYWCKKTYGSDRGYDWETDLPGGSGNKWNVLINKFTFPKPSQCLELDISSSEAHTGSRSLHMKVVKKCTYNKVIGRVSYLPTMGLWPYKETHIKYWLKLAPDVDDRLIASGKDLHLNEIRMSDADLRILAGITGKNGYLSFKAFADDIRGGWNPHWVKISKKRVPVNKWFQVEIYFKSKTYREGGGAFWVKFNGTKVIEVIPTKTKRICGASVNSASCKNPSDWNLIKLYTYDNNIEAWLDDFEIYNTLTPTSGAKGTAESPAPPTGLKVITN